MFLMLYCDLVFVSRVNKNNIDRNEHSFECQTSHEVNSDRENDTHTHIAGHVASSRRDRYEVGSRSLSFGI